MNCLKHLTEADHIEAARLLSQVQRDLHALARIVKRAPFTDRVLRVQKSVQERLIDPLRREESAADYPSVYYAIGGVR